jgi:flagellar FliL protein
MAKAEAPEALPAPAAAAPGGGKSVIKLIAALLLLTIVAAAMGGGLGIQLANQVENAIRQKESSEGKPVVEPHYTGPTHLKPLAPILTNLAEPADTWIRIESSIVFEDEEIAGDDVLVGEIGEDILAYLRTVTLSQIQGPSGMQHLREDLAERARMRSEGRVNELVIQTMVVQ